MAPGLGTTNQRIAIVRSMMRFVPFLPQIEKRQRARSVCNPYQSPPLESRPNGSALSHTAKRTTSAGTRDSSFAVY